MSPTREPDRPRPGDDPDDPPAAGRVPAPAADRAAAAGRPAGSADDFLRQAPVAIRALLDHSPAVIYVKDVHGRYVFANRRFLSIFGLGEDEVVGRLEEAIHPPEVAARIRRNDREVIEGGGPVEFDETVEHVDGPREYISVKFPLRRDGGTVWGLAGVSTDVTDRNRAVRRLDAQIRRTELILNSVGEGVYGLDPDGRVTFVNPAAAAMFGREPDALIGRRQHEVLHHGRADGGPSPRGECPIHAVLRDGEPRSVDDELFRRRDGSSFPVAYQASPIREGEAVIGAVVTFRDRTHERERDRVRRELFAARSVQERLYPARSPHVPGFDVAAAAFPAEEACGDYHDFLPQPDGTLGVVVGDVSGHGLGPALVMVQTRALLRTGFTADRTPAEVLNRLHDQLEPDLHDETYVTMLLGRLDPRTRRLEYAAAGHVGWHVAADGTPRRLDSTGAPLGLRLIPGMLTEPGPPLTLDPGDVLLLATDGVEEAMDAGGVCFGRDRVLRVVADRRGAPAAEIIARLHAACRDHFAPGPQKDDISLIVVKAL